jgi:cytochrome b involved in lipid metabolism
MAPRRFTPLEVAKHDSVDDCWLSVHGVVLNVTELLKVVAVMFERHEMQCK